MKKARFFRSEVETCIPSERRSATPAWLLAIVMAGAGCNLALEPIEDGGENSGGAEVEGGSGPVGGNGQSSGGNCASGGASQGGESPGSGGWSEGGASAVGGVAAARSSPRSAGATSSATCCLSRPLPPASKDAFRPASDNR